MNQNAVTFLFSADLFKLRYQILNSSSYGNPIPTLGTEPFQSQSAIINLTLTPVEYLQLTELFEERTFIRVRVLRQERMRYSMLVSTTVYFDKFSSVILFQRSSAFGQALYSLSHLAN